MSNQDAYERILASGLFMTISGSSLDDARGRTARKWRRPPPDPVPALAQRPARLRVRSRIRVSVRCYYYILAIILSLAELLVNDRKKTKSISVR